MSIYGHKSKIDIMNSNVVQQDRGPIDKAKTELTKEDNDDEDDQTIYLFVIVI